MDDCGIITNQGSLHHCAVSRCAQMLPCNWTRLTSHTSPGVLLGIVITEESKISEYQPVIAVFYSSL